MLDYVSRRSSGGRVDLHPSATPTWDLGYFRVGCVGLALAFCQPRLALPCFPSTPLGLGLWCYLGVKLIPEGRDAMRVSPLPLRPTASECGHPLARPPPNHSGDPGHIQVTPLPGHIPQAKAKKFLPAGASAWRANVQKRWMGHMQGRRRVSSAFDSVEDERRALVDVLRVLWRQKSELEGRPIAEICPWDLEADTPEGGASSSGASTR